MKITKIFLPFFMSLILIVGITQPLIKTSENISDKVFRLHILANSDSTYDQNLKLGLKNYILENTSDLFIGQNLEENIDIAKESLEELYRLSKEYLESQGSNYDVKTEVVKEFFETRVYDDFTLPAGIYSSLKITIGEGKGHNWWCIIFPSVCLSACSESMSDYLSEDEMELVNSGYTAKFKVVEVYEKIKSKLS
ncbi:MAG: stage II sporulation protein R [Eubacteriales bacterium]|nr:stage II sporulation protein R [Eubacteriales bacterium]